MSNQEQSLERDSTQVIDNNATNYEPSERTSDVGTKYERAPSVKQSLKANLKADDGIARSKAAASDRDKPEKADSEVRKSLTNGLNKEVGQKLVTETPVIAPQQTYVAPPADMSKEEKELFSKLPPEAQSYVSRRAYEQRADYTRKTMELSEREKEIGDVYSVVAPIRDEYARQGIAVPDLVRRSVAWDKAFKTNPTSAALEFLESYGINIEELQGAKQTAHAPQYLTREEAENLAQEKIQNEFKKINDQHLAEKNVSAVSSFISSKPLFKDAGTAHQLEAAMVPIIAGLRSQNPSAPVSELLETAYNYVTKGHPSFSILTSQLAAKQEIDRISAEAEKAKAASRSISGGPGSGSPKTKSNNLRENLVRNLSR